MAKNVTRKSSPPQENAQPENSLQALEGEVAERLGPVLSNLPRVQREQILSVALNVVREEIFSGPLPHPRHLEHYDEVLPGGADRIFQMAERTLTHNLEVTKQAQTNDQIYRILGMCLGFIALMVLVGAAVYAGLSDRLGLASGLLGTSVIGSIGAFVTAHHKK